MNRAIKSVLDAFDPHYGINTEQRWPATNINRIITELLDIPYKPGYGSEFRVSLLDDAPEPMKWLLLEIFFTGSRGNLRGRTVKGWLALVGYPDFPPALRLLERPICPDHLGGHPHVYPDGTLCWETLAKHWSRGCELYSDYIRVVLQILNKPTEHVACQLLGLE